MKQLFAILCAALVLLAATPVSAQSATFSTSPQAGTAPLVVNFSLTSGADSITYKLDFGDGSALADIRNGGGTLSNLSHTYTAAGTYAARLLNGSTELGRTIIVVGSGQNIADAKARADQEIHRRIAALTALNTKIQAMTRVSSKLESSLTATLTTEIANLNALNAKIQADTTIAALRTDIASIATDYRTFKLVIPKGYVLVSADRILTTTAAFTTFGTKMQSRISQAQGAGNDVTAMNASLATYTSKVTSATAQANTAITLVTNLVPDGGNESIAASNKAALQSASAAIKVALSDLQVARQSAASIVSALQAIGGGSAVLTAKMTINGSTNYIARVGETISYSWTSTGAVSATSNWTQDSSSCGFEGTGPFDIPLGSTVLGGVVSEVVTDCWAGHTYVNNYTVKDAAGKTVTASATVTVPPPAVPLTATLTVNGSNDVTVNVGDVVSEAWSSTGAKTADGTWTQDSSSCGFEGTGPFPFFGAPDFTSGANFGGTFQETIADCYAGHTYVYNYTATDASGQKATASATIRVKAPDIGPGPTVSLEVEKTIQTSGARSAATSLAGTQTVVAPGSNITAAVGDVVSYSWNVTGATSVKLSWIQDSTSCGYTGTGPFDYEINSAQVMGSYIENVTDCWKGHTYVVSLVATDTLGRKAVDSVTVTVPRSGTITYTHSVTNLRGDNSNVISRGPYNYDPTVIYENGIYRAYWCGGYEGDGIFYAESSNLTGPWNARGSGDPYQLALGNTGNLNDFDGLHVCDPTVMKVGGTYYMWYTGAHVPGAVGPGYVGVASSPDGITWTRMNGGKPIVTPITENPSMYGAGQQTLAYVDEKYYMIYKDTTGVASQDNGFGLYVLRADDPLFQINTETLGANGFVPLNASTKTAYSAIGAYEDGWVALDVGYSPTWNVFIALAISSSDVNHEVARVFVLDRNFKELDDVIIPSTRWWDGLGFVVDAQRNVIMKDANTISLDFLRQASASGDTNTWAGLSWRGADLVRTQTFTAAPYTNYLANAFESVLKPFLALLGQ